MRREVLPLLLAALAACSGISPLRHRFEVGQDAYLILVADAPDGRGDLWATSADGSGAVQVTFSLPAEWSPRLSPNGDIVAFLRSREEGDTARTHIWLLNLLNGAEREMKLPDSTGAPLAIAWVDDGRALLVRTTQSLFRLAAPPFPPGASEIPAGERVHAAREMSVRVGDPAFGSVAACDSLPGLCVYPDSESPALVVEGATDPFRWGTDSLAYLLDGEIVVRPVGPGRERQFRPSPSLRNPRDYTVFTGRRGSQGERQ